MRVEGDRMDPKEEALLRAIAHDFDADAPRRAYGEWLLAAGQGFGEFVLQSLVTPTAGTEDKHRKGLEKLRRAHVKGKRGKGGQRPARFRCAACTSINY